MFFEGRPHTLCWRFSYEDFSVMSSNYILKPFVAILEYGFILTMYRINRKQASLTDKFLQSGGKSHTSTHPRNIISTFTIEATIVL